MRKEGGERRLQAAKAIVATNQQREQEQGRRAKRKWRCDKAKKWVTHLKKEDVRVAIKGEGKRLVT